jgi:hypothetical protein
LQRHGVKVAVSDVDQCLRWSSQVITKHRFAQNPKTLQLFEREVSILQQLQHVSMSVALGLAIHACSFADAESDGDNDNDSRTSVR